ncbi:hypothetical protein M011DRAFT_469546 [Sporormia fimetaria CBS 119925]|uniref:CFEM domain-containing protein n=1 Tax=Sporormia fimetaria CBS 119925 TaxID=1340428 RepID=A0A6A6V4D8_9PLEO|nr:hypothetical protein M011DRAFT_469546 [Sporormia fimetaria CBS 119925]
MRFLLIPLLWTGFVTAQFDLGEVPTCAVRQVPTPEKASQTNRAKQVSCFKSSLDSPPCQVPSPFVCQCKDNAYEGYMTPCLHQSKCGWDQRQIAMRLWQTACEEVTAASMASGTPYDAPLSSSSAAPPVSSPESKAKLSTGTIAGVSVGVTFAVALLVVGVLVFWRRRRLSARYTQQEDLSRASDKEVVVVETTAKYAPPYNYELDALRSYCCNVLCIHC